MGQYDCKRIELYPFTGVPKFPFNKKEWLRNWRLDPKNKEQVRKWANDGSKRYRIEIVNLLGNKCVRCGFSDIRALEIDHIKGNGCDERRIIGKGGNKYLKYVLEKIKQGSKDYQLLCSNCNQIKKVENHEYAK